MFERHRAFKAQFAGGTLENRDRDGIVERIVKPPQPGGPGRDRQPGAYQPQVVAFTRPEHHAMLAQSDRRRITVHGDVANRQKRHYATNSGISSVQTLKPSSVFRPKVVTIATSDASRPRAISTRAIRGTLLRG